MHKPVTVSEIIASFVPEETLPMNHINDRGDIQEALEFKTNETQVP